jgi:hypothetical protein
VKSSSSMVPVATSACSTSSVLKKLMFRTATRSPKYNFDILLLQKYLSNNDVCILL